MQIQNYQLKNIRLFNKHREDETELPYACKEKNHFIQTKIEMTQSNSSDQQIYIEWKFNKKGPSSIIRKIITSSSRFLQRHMESRKSSQKLAWRPKKQKNVQELTRAARRQLHNKIMQIFYIWMCDVHVTLKKFIQEPSRPSASTIQLIEDLRGIIVPFSGLERYAQYTSKDEQPSTNLSIDLLSYLQGPVIMALIQCTFGIKINILGMRIHLNAIVYFYMQQYWNSKCQRYYQYFKFGSRLLYNICMLKIYKQIGLT